MATPIHGILSKQGPVASLSNFISGEEDRFLFNGQQFVSVSAQSPKVVTASARKSTGFTSLTDVTYVGFNNFKDIEGTYRFVNGTPTLNGIFTNWPESYDHVVIGYDNQVSTATIKFWSKYYVDTGLIKVDYSHDDEEYFNISGASVSYSFDDTIKHTPDEAIPSGMYVYTIALGSVYTAKYWRVRCFLMALVTTDVTGSVSGKDVIIGSTTGWPATGDAFVYSSPNSTQSSAVVSSSFSSASYNAALNKVVISDLKIGYHYAGFVYSGILKVTETFFDWDKNKEVTESIGYAYFGQYINGSSINLSSYSASSPGYFDVSAFGKLPDGAETGDIGPRGGEIDVELTLYFSRSHTADLTYTSKDSTSLQTVSSNELEVNSDTLKAGSVVKYDNSFEVEQVRIKDETIPLMRFWESDGGEAVTKELKVSDVYDAVFDRSDDIYYLVGYRPTGGAGPGPDDTFDGDLGTAFNSNRWSLLGGAFRRDSSNNSFLYENSVSGTSVYGSLTSNYYNSGSYTSELDLLMTTLSGNGFIGLVAKDESTNNQVAGSFAVGDWHPNLQAAYMGTHLSDIYNATDGYAAIRNFRFDPYNMPTSEYRHTLTYSSSTWLYSRTALGIAYLPDVVDEDVGDVSYISKEGFALTVDHSDSIADGAYISFVTNKVTVSGASQDDITLKVEYDSSASTLTTSADESGSPVSLFTSGVDLPVYRSEVYGKTDNYTTVSGSAYTYTGSSSINMPSLFVRAVDNNGEVSSVSGVTDADGYAIKYLDVVREYGSSYGDNYKKVSIATSGQTEALGGSLFVRVGEDLYKYNKTTLPLAAVEDGSNTSVLASGVVSSEAIYNFSYDHYTNGGLSYVQQDSSRGGVYLKEISDSTLHSVPYEAGLGLSTASVPLAWDPEDSSVLYTVSGSTVYVFNTDEDDVAFISLHSDEVILPANSSATSNVTASVINLFGDPLPNKTTYFSITYGGGSISPATSCTTASGTATVLFTSATVSGTSIITATASNDSC